MHDAIFAISPAVRYVAVYRNGQLSTHSKNNISSASSAESDRYEELLVNPILITSASQRGNIDCGGLHYLLIRYGHFFQFVLPMAWGHVSVCLEAESDPVALARQIMTVIQNRHDI